jgi:DHA1 family bicyclomycin/chloramphenicol resistance-like MFS transporter
MPEFARELNASVAATQFTLAAYAIALALMHLAYGPLADRFGRRRVLMAALAIFVAGSLLCALAPDIETLIAARMLQGVGAAAGPIVGRAIVRDVFGAAGGGRAMGTVMAWFGVGAIAMPILGGLAVEFLGWRATFVIAALYAAALWLAVLLHLPETRPAGAGAAWLSGMGTLFGDRRFFAVALSGCLIASSMFCWISGSSFVVMRVFGHSPTAYSLFYGITILGFIAASLISGRLAPRLGSQRLLGIGCVIAATGGLAGLVVGWAGAASLALILAAIVVVATGHGITLPQSTAGAMAPFPHLAATASALFGFMNFVINASVTAANGLLFDGTARPMLYLIAGLTGAGLLLYALARPRPR